MNPSQKVNGKNVMNDSHDDVAGEIRDGCKQISEMLENTKNKEEKAKEVEENVDEVWYCGSISV